MTSAGRSAAAGARSTRVPTWALTGTAANFSVNGSAGQITSAAAATREARVSVGDTTDVAVVGHADPRQAAHGLERVRLRPGSSQRQQRLSRIDPGRHQRPGLRPAQAGGQQRRSQRGQRGRRDRPDRHGRRRPSGSGSRRSAPTCAFGCGRPPIPNRAAWTRDRLGQHGGTPGRREPSGSGPTSAAPSRTARWPGHSTTSGCASPDRAPHPGQGSG